VTVWEKRFEKHVVNTTCSISASKNGTSHA
jgi:hypothetical protein